MGIDFTSNMFPYKLEFFEDEQGEENHQEPAGEDVKSSVVDYDHPLLSTKGLKNTINLNRALGNSKEDLLKGDIKPKVLQDIVKAAYKNKFPIEVLIFALDVEKKMDERSSAGEAESIISKIRSFVPQLKNTLGRQPTNSEVMMAYMLGSAGQVKTLLEKAKEKPYEDATPIGSKFDNIIFKKLKVGKEVLRKNKEVVQYFQKRTIQGNVTFPHSPFNVGNKTI